MFFHGQKTNAEVAWELLKAQGWLGFADFADFVIFDGPHLVDADTDAEQLERVGLTRLVQDGKYVPGNPYREWCANFETFFEIHVNARDPASFTAEKTAEEQRYKEAFDYLAKKARTHGPFDFVAGFCQGAAFAQAALWAQKHQQDLGLGTVRAMIAMAPWQCPYHEQKGCFQQPLDKPLLLFHGRKDCRELPGRVCGKLQKGHVDVQ